MIRLETKNFNTILSSKNIYYYKNSQIWISQILDTLNLDILF